MRIEHSALYCKDIESMRAFFVEFFDAQSNDMYHNPRTGLRTYFLSFGDGGARLELMTRPGVTDAGQPGAHLGYAHLAFSVGGKDAVDTLTRRLSSAGYAVASGPRLTGDGYYESCIVGPENILIEITE